MTNNIPEHEVGSGNVFADIGRPDAETQLLKAGARQPPADIITERKLSQVKAAAILGIAQPDLSNILHGRFRGTSVERLMRFLTALGCEVDIVLRRAGTPAREERSICSPPWRKTAIDEGRRIDAPGAGPTAAEMSQPTGPADGAGIGLSALRLEPEVRSR